MKYLCVTASLVVFLWALPQLSYSQSPWCWQNPWPQGNDLASVWAFSSDKFVASGGNGTLVTTNDAGISWTVSYADTLDVRVSLRSMQFVDSLQGWSVGGRDGTMLPRFIYRTTDGGHHWSRQSTHNVELVSVFFANEHNGWAVGGFSDGVILKTTDGGTTWIDRSNDSLDALADVFFIDTLSGWAVGIHGFIVKTEDGGESWRNVSLQIPDVLQLLSVYFVSSTVGWVAGTARLQGFIAKTTDGGLSWGTQLLSPTEAMFSDLCFVDDMRGWAVGGAGELSSGNVYRTSNGGTSWASSATGSTFPLHSIHFSDTLNGWSAGNHGRILASTDGGDSWFERSRGPRATIRSMASYDTLTAIAVGQAGIVLRTTNGGQEWTTQVVDSLVDLYGLAIHGSGFAWAVGTRRSNNLNVGVLLKSQNAGQTWETALLPQVEGLVSVDFTSADSGWALAWDDVRRLILHTTNGGEYWSNRILDTSGLFVLTNSVSFIDNQTGWITLGSAVYRTTNGGGIWIPHTNGIEYPVEGVVFVTPLLGWTCGGIQIFDRERSQGEGVIYRTTDGGVSWTEQLHIVKDAFVAIDFVDTEPGWAVGYNGLLYSTTNGGLTWRSQVLPSRETFFDAHFTDAAHGWVCGNSGTILGTSPGSTITSVTTSPVPVHRVDPQLLSSYPNPFNYETIIKYTVLHPSSVNISVYNVLGQLMATLRNGDKLPGTYSVLWDGKTETGQPLPSGVYFLRLITKETSYTTKAVLLR